RSLTASCLGLGERHPLVEGFPFLAWRTGRLERRSSPECERKDRVAISCESPREKRKQGVWMMRKIVSAALIALAVGPALAQSPPAGTPTRIRGTVDKLDGQNLE